MAGIRPLEIESGRYANTLFDHRLCTVCNLLYVENEYHFLFTCIAYQLEIFYVNNVLDIGEIMLLADEMKLKWLPSEENVKESSNYVETLYLKQRQIHYNAS